MYNTWLLSIRQTNAYGCTEVEPRDLEWSGCTKIEIQVCHIVDCSIKMFYKVIVLLKYIDLFQCNLL